MGLSEEEFAAEQSARDVELRRHEAEERLRPERLYLFLESPDQRAAALKLVEDQRQSNEAFLYLTSWGPDPNPERPDGIELKFSRSPAGLREQIISALKMANCKPKPEYHEIVGVGEKTEERHSSQPTRDAVITMPKRAPEEGDERWRQAA